MSKELQDMLKNEGLSYITYQVALERCKAAGITLGDDLGFKKIVVPKKHRLPKDTIQRMAGTGKYKPKPSKNLKPKETCGCHYMPGRDSFDSHGPPSDPAWDFGPMSNRS